MGELVEALHQEIVMPFWISGVLTGEAALVAVLFLETVATQCHQNQSQRLLERLILGAAGEPERRPWWRRLWNG